MRALHATLCLALTLGSSGGALRAAQDGPSSCPGRPAKGTAARSLGAAGPQLLLDEDFPDPFVARFGKEYHAYGTGVKVGGVQLNVQRRRSTGLIDWSPPAEALPKARLPAWVDRNDPQVWAPEVIEVGGRYVLYFNARHATLTRTETPKEGPTLLKRHCLGVAVADSPDGEFTGIDEPLVCAEFEEGVIDAGVFRDGDSLYLFYKHDGNCCGRKTAIYAQGLSPDGLAPVGPRHKLIENNDSPGEEDDWEWWVVEAPTMVKRKGAYYLFYSGNFFGNKHYSVAYLKCASPRGPCRDQGDNPILRSHDASPLLGPGHQSLLEAAGSTLIFFHGWDWATGEQGGRKRCLYAGRVQWEGSGDDERPRVVGGKPAGNR